MRCTKWKVRARQGDYVGPWSAEASFKAPAGGYIRGNEVFDPLTNGKTAGEPNGPVQFIPGQGLKLQDHKSFVRYRLPVNLQQGEFSMMVLGADEGSPGDKSKIFSMQEGPDEGRHHRRRLPHDRGTARNQLLRAGIRDVPHHRRRRRIARRRTPSCSTSTARAGTSGSSSWQTGSARLEVRSR